MKTYQIEKRLAAVEQKRKTPGTIVSYFPSRADSTAYYLSGGMEEEEPCVNGTLKIKLHWGVKPLQAILSSSSGSGSTLRHRLMKSGKSG